MVAAKDGGKLTKLIRYGWWGLLLSLIPIICLFNNALIHHFFEVFFFVGLILADIKNKERWLNVGIYGVVSMIVSVIAIHTYDFSGLFEPITLYVFFGGMVVLVIWRSWAILSRSESEPVPIQW
jgi:hypothetical protein